VADVLRSLAHYRRVFHRLLDLAAARTPDLIVLVDFTGFNRRFAHALRQRVLRQSPLFGNWRLRLVQYVSPQVWASRPGRADAMARDLDLLLCLFPFERDWYARRVPQMRVEWVGHPICDRYPDVWRAAVEGRELNPAAARSSHLLLLPGSRRAELRRHLPVMLAATDLLAARRELRPRIVLPGETLRPLAEELLRAHRAARPAEKPVPVTLQRGGLADALREARVALASTGTVTLECALFGVPTVALYKTSWTTYQIARRVAKVSTLAMPNILAGRKIFPEFLQDAATPENLAAAVRELWRDKKRRATLREELRKIARALGGPGAAARAAAQVARLFHPTDR
jgi:lipid-A-disaccharide synthase